MEDRFIDFSDPDQIKNFFEDEILDDSEKEGLIEPDMNKPVARKREPPRAIMSKEEIINSLGTSVSLQMNRMITNEGIIEMLGDELKERLTKSPGKIPVQTLLNAIKVISESQTDTMSSIKGLMTSPNNESDPIINNILINNYNQGSAKTVDLGLLGGNFQELEELRLAAETVISESQN